MNTAISKKGLYAGKRYGITSRFKKAIESHPGTLKSIAEGAGVDYKRLSHILCMSVNVREGDPVPRLVADFIGFKGQVLKSLN